MNEQLPGLSEQVHSRAGEIDEIVCCFRRSIISHANCGWYLLVEWESDYIDKIPRRAAVIKARAGPVHDDIIALRNFAKHRLYRLLHFAEFDFLLDNPTEVDCPLLIMFSKNITA